jgi:hypothetical protein
MWRSKYKASGSCKGLYAEIQICDPVTNAVVSCIDNTCTDIRHSVTIENLMLYPANLRFCNGCIISDPPKAEFCSAVKQSVQGPKWTVQNILIPEQGAHTIDHVSIIPIDNGSDNIGTEVDVEWPHQGQSGKIKKFIRVKTKI